MPEIDGIVRYSDVKDSNDPKRKLTLLLTKIVKCSDVSYSDSRVRTTTAVSWTRITL